MRVHWTTSAAMSVAALLACSGQEDSGTPATQAAVRDSVAELSPPPAAVQTKQLALPFSLPHEVEEPCDYCLDPIVVCRMIQARTRDDPDAPVVTVLQPGDTLTLVTGRLHVLTPDVVVFSDTLRLAGTVDPRSSSREVRSIVFLPGDTVYVLTYENEGSEGEWWYRGKMWRSGNAWMSAVNLPFVSRDGRLVATSLGTYVSQWWMKVRDADGREGWVEDDGSSVTYGNYYEPDIPPCAGESGGASSR